jgi:pimeloyl-ACP methyl ester carboxylesterase
MPYAEEAVAHNDFALLERLWRDWSPGWDYPMEEIQAVKETFQQPGVLTAALSYYRHSFNPANRHPALEAVRARRGERIAVPTLYFHGEQDGGIGLETAEGMENWFMNGLRKCVIPDAGHFVHQEQPEKVNRSLLEFLCS